MRLSVERLRWALVAAALLLIAVLAVLLGYSRYRAVKAWRQIVSRSGATITHEAHEVTYSQAVRGRTVFTIHAADAMPHGDGKYTLRNVVLLLYGANGTGVDRVSGSEFDYDEKNQVARALGEVHMDLQAPQALSPGDHGQPPTRAAQAGAQGSQVPETPQTIHVRTSGLVYMRKLGVAATDQEVEIAYQGFHGYAKGARFDSAQSVVHLLADVRIDGTLPGQPAHLTAASADLDRTSNLIRLTQPRVQSGSGSKARDARAEQATVHLRRGGTVEQVEARGNLILHSSTEAMRAAFLNATMDEQSLLQRADLGGGVQMDDANPARPVHGLARNVTITCDTDGTARNVLAQGGVSIAAEQPRPGGAPLHRQMAANRVALAYRRASGGHSSVLSAIEATGAASVRGESVPAKTVPSGGQVRTTELAGDTLRLEFASAPGGKDSPQLLTANGHTRLTRTAPDGAMESSTSDSLVAHFAASDKQAQPGHMDVAGLRLVSADQTGHVRLRSQPAVTAQRGAVPEITEAAAERADFDGAADRSTLTGSPVIRQDGSTLSAGTIVLSQSGGDAEAHGAVAGTFAAANSAPEAAVTHVAARDATLRRAEQTAEFRGTDAQPARIWQGASQIQAARLLLNRAQDRLVARPLDNSGLVHAVFAAQNGPNTGAGGTRRKPAREDATGRVVRVSSAKLDYSGTSREAVFTGGVRAEAAGGEVRGSRAVVFLYPLQTEKKPVSQPAAGRTPEDALGGAVEKMVVSGNVSLEEPGRNGTGEQLLYTSANQEFVLTGSPGQLARISNENQGSITGATLLFGAADSTIVVAGEPGARGQTHGRVHTETVVKP